MTDQTNEPKILRFKERGPDETHVQVQENPNQTQEDHIAQNLLDDDSSNNYGQSGKFIHIKYIHSNTYEHKITQDRNPAMPFYLISQTKKLYFRDHVPTEQFEPIVWYFIL